MSRAVRITVGAVVAGTLAFVAVVAGVMAVSGSGAGGGFFEELGTEYLDTYATAEVLDVDDDWDWPTVDVRWTTPEDEVVVTAVDWEWTDVLPTIGDDVEVVYDSADPEWAFAADDPFVDSAPAVTGGPDEEQVEGADAADDGLGRAAGWVSLGALVALVLTAVVTVVAAVRAPAPAERSAPGTGPYGPPGPAGQPPPPSFVGHPYPPPPGYAGPPYPPPSHPSASPTQHGAPRGLPTGDPGPAYPPSSGRADGWSAP